MRLISIIIRAHTKHRRTRLCIIIHMRIVYVEFITASVEKGRCVCVCGGGGGVGEGEKVVYFGQY